MYYCLLPFDVLHLSAVWNIPRDTICTNVNGRGHDWWCKLTLSKVFSGPSSCHLRPSKHVMRSLSSEQRSSGRKLKRVLWRRDMRDSDQSFTHRNPETPHTHTSLFLDASLNPHKHATANVYNMTYFWVFRKESIHRNDWWMNAECHFSALTYWWLAPEEVPRSFPQEQHRDPTLTLLSGHLKPGQGARRLHPWGNNPTTHDCLA